MEFSDNQVWLIDDLKDITPDADESDDGIVYLKILFKHEPTINLGLTKKDFDLFKKKLNEMEWE